MIRFTVRTLASITRLAAVARGPLLATLLVMMATSQSGYPQVLYGALTGNVTDQTGAIAAGVKVQALNVATNVATSATTDSRGVYRFTDLQPGVYTITIEAQGFKKLVQRSVPVDSNALRRVDAQLQLSDVSETVEVTARAPLLQTDRGDVHVIQTAREVNDLPLVGGAGRNYQTLMQVVPGALMAGEQNSAAGSPQRSISFNVNGVSRLQNNTKLDGASIVYPWLPTNTAYVPSAEAIDEVSIVTNSYNAEQGLVGGAAINVIIKSGTNAIHGAAWEYRTDSGLKAKNFFQTAPTNPKDTLDQFGANVGGPILKDKLFFFANWERTNRDNASPVRLYSLATDALRRGDFSGTGVTIYDPLSNPDPAQRTPFPGNIIPANRIDPAALELIKLMPLPTGSGFANNYTANGEGNYRRDNIDLKLNYHASNRLSLFGRYSLSPSNIFDPPSLGGAGGDALNGGQLGNAPGRTQLAGLGGTYTFSPNLLLDVNLGYTRQRLGAENVDINSNFGLDVLHIPGTNGPDRLQGGMPSFQLSGWANLGNPNTGNPFLFRDNQYVGAFNLQWIRQSHSMRFGLDYQNQQLNHFQPQGGTFQTVRGTLVFNGNSTRLQNGPTPSDTRFNSWADFLLGLPNTAGKVDQLRNPNSLRIKAYALYAQDSWQVTRRLTLNYGLRWELYPWPTRDHGGVSRFDPSDGNVYTGGVGGVPLDTGTTVGIGQFLPRAGLAFRLNDKTVFRGGFGLSSDPKPYIDFRNAYPINFAWSFPTPTFNGASNTFVPVTTLRQGLVPAPPSPDLTQGVIKLPASVGTTTFPKDSQRKTIQSWNVALQRELYPWLSAQLAYVGTLARGQQGFLNINAAAPGTGTAGRPLAALGILSDINMIAPVGDATYNALQADLRGRLTSAQFGVSYTLSKATNYQDNDGNPRIPWLPAIGLNKAVAGFDRTHVLQAYWLWDLPFGKDRRWANGGLSNALLGGWQLNGALQLMSGTPINVIQGNSGNLNAPGSGQYPDLVKSTVDILGGVGAGHPYFDTGAFAQVNIPSGDPQRFGNAGRNPIRGPGFFNIDCGLYKAISLTGRARVQLRVDVLNVLNHPNLANPGGDISNSATFGIISQTINEIGTTNTGERQIRLGARVSF